MLRIQTRLYCTLNRKLCYTMCPVLSTHVQASVSNPDIGTGLATPEPLTSCACRPFSTRSRVVRGWMCSRRPNRAAGTLSLSRVAHVRRKSMSRPARAHVLQLLALLHHIALGNRPLSDAADGTRTQSSSGRRCYRRNLGRAVRCAGRNATGTVGGEAETVLVCFECLSPVCN